MRFANGPVPLSRTFDPVAAHWTPLRESDSRGFAVAGALWSCPFLVAATALFLHAAPMLRPYLRQPIWSLPCLLAVLVALGPVHELIHAVAYGCGLDSPNLIAGIWPRRGLAYVLYDSPLPRRRVLWMLIAPLFTLSVLPLFAVPFLSGPWLLLLAFLCLLHTAMCAGDAITIVRLLRQTPPGAVIHNNGWQTYWTAPPIGHRAA
jgi:hypothetical protein